MKYRRHFILLVGYIVADHVIWAGLNLIMGKQASFTYTGVMVTALVLAWAAELDGGLK